MMAGYAAERDKYQPDWNDWRNGYVLPHKCDEWFIGDEDDVKALIDDLQRLLARAIWKKMNSHK